MSIKILEDCPCCGGSDIKEWSEDNPMFCLYHVECEGCHMQSNGESALGARQRWNRRAQSGLPASERSQP